MPSSVPKTNLDLLFPPKMDKMVTTEGVMYSVFHTQFSYCCEWIMGSWSLLQEDTTVRVNTVCLSKVFCKLKGKFLNMINIILILDCSLVLCM